jgi:putative oxidoreductase
MADAATIAVQPSRVNWLRWILLAARLILGAIFIYSAISKLKDPWMLFAMAVNSYQILPEWAVTVVARGLPWFELLLGAFLISGWKLRWSALAADGLLGTFLAVNLYSFIKNPHSGAITCGCFGAGEKLGPLTLAIDASMFAVALAVTIGAYLALRRRA